MTSCPYVHNTYWAVALSNFQVKSQRPSIRPYAIPSCICYVGKWNNGARKSPREMFFFFFDPSRSREPFWSSEWKVNMLKSTRVSKRVDIKVLKVKNELWMSRNEAQLTNWLDFKVGQSHGPVSIIFKVLILTQELSWRFYVNSINCFGILNAIDLELALKQGSARKWKLIRLENENWICWIQRKLPKRKGFQSMLRPGKYSF